MIKNDNPRSKYFTLELYEESENICFKDKIKFIEQYEYCYIKHDKDNKKYHYHIVIFFNNYRYLNSISEEFEIPKNYFEPVNSLQGILTYLIHLNDKSKYQYNIKEVIGSKKALDKLYKAYKNNGLEEETKIIELLEYIERSEFLTFSTFIKYACSIGRFDIVRRSQYLFCKIIDEHNKKVINLVDDLKLSWYN